METIILYIGRDPKMAAILHRLLNNKPGWKGFTALTNTEAQQLTADNKPQVVLLGSGISTAEERELRTFFAGFPNVKVIQHYGGGSGLLYNEIQQVLS
ncbi:hypothetical protein C7T94_15670 [Pedobacter yulinensis]|uniref:Uncharacterized protein n=1 Tax=Pedobacter yulinensis TaxID=2126353 RepID=A0A2T3HIK0_9SPHI|nr:hypothetical protein [Pedobacter yulinensis]PST82233.1 hypothetical protein C7T94_15670 [Pedobacter yulinensis]